MTILLQLMTNCLVLLCRVIAIGVNHVQQHCRTLDVAQKLVAQAFTLRCTLDKTGNISDKDAPVVDVRHTEIWRQCRKLVVSYLRLGI